MIHTCLELSTSHLTEEAMREIFRMQEVQKRIDLGWPPMSIATYDHGAFVTVPAKDFGRWEQLPESLRDCLLLADGLGVSLVSFNNDGDECDHLPTYDW